MHDNHDAWMGVAHMASSKPPALGLACKATKPENAKPEKEEVR